MCNTTATQVLCSLLQLGIRVYNCTSCFAVISSQMCERP